MITNQKGVSMTSGGRCKFGCLAMCSIVLMGRVFLMAAPANAQISVVSNPEFCAPLNPDFEKYLADDTASLMERSDGHALGHRPPVFKFPPPSKPVVSAEQAAAFPATWDLRTIGGVTPVGNQVNCASCWTFGAIASLESYLKYKRRITANFSESDLNENHGFDIPACMGGNAQMVAAYMAKWGGPVSEVDVPYTHWLEEQGGSSREGGADGQSLAGSPLGTTPGAPTVYHVQKIYFLPQSSKPLSAADINTLKAALQANGAVDVSVHWDANYYNSTYKSFYYPIAGQYPNHDVAIVGWNDNYSKTKFRSQPPGNGAFIAKNSWGTAWGDGGYFYMSYYDKALDLAAQFCNAESATYYSRIYQYDNLGLVTFWNYGRTNTAWGANIFKASAHALHIKAVSIWTPVKNSSYTIYVYKNPSTSLTTPNPRSGSLLTSKAGTITDPGYTTIPLNTAFVTANQPFSVVVKLTTPNYSYPLAIEYAMANVSTAGTACRGQSFVSQNGTRWSYCEDFNVCVKAFASP